MTTMQSPHRWSNPVIDAAYALAASRQMCCAEDLTLLVDVVRDLSDRPYVVQLGAGSGTMALAVLGARDDVTLWSYDIDQQALNWERQALKNAKVDFDPKGLRTYIQINQDSVDAGRRWGKVKQIDLLIIDADHSYEGVKADLEVWLWHCDLVFVHDYDGATAPSQYPGVAKACGAIWVTKPPLHKAGWSAVFRSPWNVHRQEV